MTRIIYRIKTHFPLDRGPYAQRLKTVLIWFKLERNTESIHTGSLDVQIPSLATLVWLDITLVATFTFQSAEYILENSFPDEIKH